MSAGGAGGIRGEPSEAVDRADPAQSAGREVVGRDDLALSASGEAPARDDLGARVGGEGEPLADPGGKMSPALEPGSPVSNVALEAAASKIATAWRVVQRRAPREVNRRVRRCLERVYAVVHDPAARLRERIALARLLENIDAELHAREAFEATFYREGRLGILRAWDPVRIRGAVDHAAIERRFERYVSGAERAIMRLNYFLSRAGVEQEEEGKIKPWDTPYASMNEYHELLWGRVRQDIT